MNENNLKKKKVIYLDKRVDALELKVERLKNLFLCHIENEDEEAETLKGLFGTPKTIKMGGR